MLTYIQTFNTIKTHFLTKKRTLFLKNTKKNKCILHVFLKANLILGFKLSNDENIKVFLTALPSPYKLKNFFNLTRPRYIKIKDINKYKNKNTGSIYILSTSKGLLTLQEAIEYKVGGVLMFKLQ